jgi:predicted metal-dependent enzyme (double-stranded beta helix superfamily)
LARRLAVSPDLEGRIDKHCDIEQGFGFQLLHEEEDHSLAVAVLSWLPGRGTPPHDHGTWGVVVGVEGNEVNLFWRRTDDRSRTGYARLEQANEKIVSRGDTVALLPDTIHSVRNDTDRVSVSLHVYGTHVNYTERFQFDVGRNTIAHWKVTQTFQAHPVDRRSGPR